MKKLAIILLFPSVLLGQLDIKKIVDHAIWQTTQETWYNPAYVKIDYPWGDVDMSIGVCTDVIIRAFRADSLDLQKEIHEDILKYPSNYNLKVVDRNIDHRRCKNIRNYIKRHNGTIPVTKNAKDYLPGDLVFWDCGLEHVGIVTDQKVEGTDRYYVVHNIGRGPQIEDYLFLAPIIYHGRLK